MDSTDEAKGVVTVPLTIFVDRRRSTWNTGRSKSCRADTAARTGGKARVVRIV